MLRDAVGAAPVFSALGDAVRLDLLDRLSLTGPQSITHLAEGTHLTRQGITKHLHVLANVGLVRNSRRGREHIWALAPGGLDVAQSFMDHMAQRWDTRLDRLKALVER